MNILEYIGSVNKISLVVLAVIFLFLLYEFYLFRKDQRRKVVVSVPSFDPSQRQAVIKTATPLAAHHEIPAKIKKPHKKVNKKTIGVIVVSVLMASSIGAISFRLSQRSPQNASVAPARPKAASLPTASPTSFLLPSSEPSRAIEASPAPTRESPTEKPSQQNISPTSKPPLLFAKNLSQSFSISPTQRAQPTKTNLSPTEIISEPTVQPTFQSQKPTEVIATSQPGVQTLPQSGTADYSIFLIAAASLIIVISFLY